MKLNCLTIGIRQKHIELRPNISFIQIIFLKKKIIFYCKSTSRCLPGVHKYCELVTTSNGSSERGKWQ